MYDLRIETTAPPGHDAIRKRFRWETLLIVLAATCIAGGGVAAILQMDRPSERRAKRTAPTTRVQSAPQMSLEAAQAAVAQARTQLASGQFETSAATLETIPEGLQESSGATALLAEIDARYQDYQDASAHALDLLDASKFEQAVLAFDQVEAIAPLEPELADARGRAARMAAGYRALKKARATQKSGNLTAALALAKSGQRTYPEISDFEVLAVELRTRLDERAAARKKAQLAADERRAAQAAASAENSSGGTNHAGHTTAAPASAAVDDLNGLGLSLDAGEGGAPV